jgi:hypothetical protein
VVHKSGTVGNSLRGTGGGFGRKNVWNGGKTPEIQRTSGH